MAIVTEHVNISGRDFVRTYSDKGMKIHGGFPESNYDDACDSAELNRTYTETDIPIDSDNLPNNLDASIEYLVESHLVDFSAEESSPDYLNEHEHEFNYFE